MTVLVIAEHDGHLIRDVTLNTVMAACHISVYLDGQIHVLVTGTQSPSVREQAARINGVSKVIVADARLRDHYPGRCGVAQVQSIARTYNHILFVASAAGKQAAERLAAGLGVQLTSNISGVVSPNTFTCVSHAVHIPATVHNHDPVKVITVRATAFEAALRDGGIGHVEQVLTPAACASVRSKVADKRQERTEFNYSRMTWPRTHATEHANPPDSRVHHRERPYFGAIAELFDDGHSVASYPTPLPRLLSA